MRAAVAPVADALWRDAQDRVERVRTAAEHDARAEIARATDEAARLLDEARADGTRAAAQLAAVKVADAHRQARGVVLAARRAAYDAARRRALDALEHGGSAEELGNLLESLARRRVGPTASIHRSGPGALRVVATAGNRRAAIGPAELVDRAMRALAEEVATLWA